MTISNPYIEESILVLGHTGLLGNQVMDYFMSINKNVMTTNLRWPNSDFKDFITSFKGVVINCIGAIPQSGIIDYKVNYELPIFLLENNKIKLIQPDTDCVFSGNIPIGECYKKNDIMDAQGPYPLSKINFIKEALKRNPNNLKIIRTSIIGFDKKSQSLLSWFLKTSKNSGKCQGYANHMWNGITTFEWSKLSSKIIDDWQEYDLITQIGSNQVSKYDLLNIFSKVFEIQCDIIQFSTSDTVNKCLKTDIQVPDLLTQIRQISNFKKYEA